MSGFRLRLFGRELQYDRGYGIDRRSGWSACVNGSFRAELTGFWRAICVLLTK